MLMLLASFALSCEEGQAPALPSAQRPSGLSVGWIIFVVALAVALGIALLCIKCCCCNQKETVTDFPEDEQEDIPIVSEIYGASARPYPPDQPEIVVSLLPDVVDWGTRDAIPEHTPAQV
jgi:hypothetical protein